MDLSIMTPEGFELQNGCKIGPYIGPYSGSGGESSKLYFLEAPKSSSASTNNYMLILVNLTPVPTQVTNDGMRLFETNPHTLQDENQLLPLPRGGLQGYNETLQGNSITATIRTNATR
jgi:hypothetical protein